MNWITSLFEWWVRCWQNCRLLDFMQILNAITEFWIILIEFIWKLCFFNSKSDFFRHIRSFLVNSIFHHKMGDNAGNNNGSRPTNNRKTTGNNFFRMRHRFQSNRQSGPRERPVSLLIPQPNQSSASTSGANSSNASSSTSAGRASETASFRINRKSGPYSGWQLYFPETGTSAVLKSVSKC